MNRLIAILYRLDVLEVWTVLLQAQLGGQSLLRWIPLPKGAIPETRKAPIVLLGHNRLEGSIPEHLLDSRDPLQKWLVARTSEAQSPGSDQQLHCAFKVPNPFVCRLAWAKMCGACVRGCQPQAA
eukprot:3420212-Amphidinium_carterae.1